MAEGTKAAKGKRAAPKPPKPLADDQLAPLVTALGGGRLDLPAILGIADVLPVMIAYVDRELVLRFANRPLAEWIESDRSELIGTPVLDILGKEAFAERKPMYEAALAGKRTFLISEFDHPSRGPVAIKSDYMPWADRKGAIRGVIVTVQDVTEQRAAEQALRESEERFRRIANSAPVMMWVTRLDRVRDFVNDHYAEFVSNGDREVARTLDWRTRIHPDDIDRVVAESIAGEATLAPFTLEARYLRHDGEYRWLRSVSQPRFGADGKLSGFIGVASDITVAKEAELELRREVEESTRELAQSESRFRAVFEAALEVMVLLESDGTIIAVNNRQELWRHPHPQESLGQKLWEAPTLRAYPQHIPLIKGGVAKAAAGETFTTEAKLERAGAPTAYLDVSIQPVRGGDGEILYLLFEARDITDLKFAQEQLRQSQKMEALGQLTGGIAHDFNNLLTIIVGGLDIITKRVSDAKLKRYADNALAAAERGARLTGQLLTFSRVQRLEVRPIRIAPLIEDLRPLLRNVLGPGIAKHFELNDTGVAILADPTQVEVAVLNLAINARDAMPDGGVLTFSTKVVDIRGDHELENGKYVELSINDTGVGMSEDVAERAFEPFYTTKDIGRGTGLGLSMVYGMARQSGGTARLSSREGEGAAVKLYFRVAEPESAAAGERPADDRGAAKSGSPTATLLVVDDDPDVRNFIVTTLEDQGYHVLSASDGREALDLVEREIFDLIILDFIMPGMSGADVADAILAERPGQPILFVSGYSETEAVKRTAPQSPLLSKPFRAETLIQAVAIATSSDGTARPA